MGRAERLAGAVGAVRRKIRDMAQVSLDELLNLPAAERIEIAQKIWDSIAADAIGR